MEREGLPAATPRALNRPFRLTIDKHTEGRSRFKIQGIKGFCNKNSILSIPEVEGLLKVHLEDDGWFLLKQI
jgi:hypothetical protein